MHRYRRSIAAAVLLAAAAGNCAVAQTARSGGNASAELYQQLQQLASDRTSLQAENEKLKAELADVKKDRDALEAGQQAINRRARDTAAALAQTTEARQAADQELTQTKARMQELIAKFRETIDKLRAAEIEGATAKQSLTTREHELQACVDHNLALYHLNGEVLKHFERQGFWSRLAQSEPFTRIKRVQNDNLIDDYRSRAQDQLTPGAKPGAHQTGGAPAARPARAPAASPDGAH